MKNNFKKYSGMLHCSISVPCVDEAHTRNPEVLFCFPQVMLLKLSNSPSHTVLMRVLLTIHTEEFKVIRN